MPGQAYSLNSDSLHPSQLASVGIMMLTVKEIKSADIILFSDLYQEHNRDQLFSLPGRVQRRAGLQMEWKKWDGYVQSILIKAVCQREAMKGRQEDEGQPRKSWDSAAGQQCQVRRMVINAQFCFASDKSTNINLKVFF